jgi:hypothetical protein
MRNHDPYSDSPEPWSSTTTVYSGRGGGIVMQSSTPRPGYPWLRPTTLTKRNWLGGVWESYFQWANQETRSESQEFCQFLYFFLRQMSHLGRRAFSTNCAEGRPYLESNSVNISVGYGESNANICLQIVAYNR